MNYGKKHASKRQREITSKKNMQKKKIGSRLFKSVILCILIIGITCAIGVGLFVKKTIDDAPVISPEDVKPTGFTTFVVDQNGNELDKFRASGANRVYKTNAEIPDYLKKAFVAIEDSRFYTHNGIDLKGIVRAGVIGITSGDFSQGASTITQQLIKNTVFPDFINEGKLDKVKRKIQEQYLAVAIEKQMDKDIILENYMNTINLGQNTLGVQAASKRYFNKDVSDLTLSECAVIAGITQRPGAYNPITNPELSAKRRKKVLEDMLEQGKISQAEYDEAMADNVFERIQNVNSQLSTGAANSYFIDALADQVIEDLQNNLGYSESQAINALYSGGLTVYATQDREIQNICDEEMNNNKNYPSSISVGVEYALTITRQDGTQENYSSGHLKKFGREQYNDKAGLLFATEEKAKERIEAFKASLVKEGDKVDERMNFTPQPQASAVVIDHTTGHVKALVGGRGPKTSDRSLNRATDSPRQPGSAFKIVAVYAPALDSAGQSIGTVTKDEPFERNGKKFKNAYRGFKGNITMREAIEDSSNIVALKTFEEISPQLGIDYAQKLGITTLVKQKVINGETYTDYQLPTALGGLTDGAYNIDMAAAYATIANGGVYNKPVFYTKVLDHDGNILLESSSETKKVLRESTAFLLTSAMEDVVKKGTGRVARLSNMTCAGKTGTSTGPKDSWFCGFTPYYTCSIWVGYDDPVTNLPDGGTFNQKLWKGIMSRIHQGFVNKSFEKPGSVEKVKVCSISGKIASSSCPYHREYMAMDNGSGKKCTSHEGYPGSIGGISTDEENRLKEEQENQNNTTPPAGGETTPPAGNGGESAPPSGGESGDAGGETTPPTE